MHPPFTTTKCHQLDWLVPLSLHFWYSCSLSQKNWVPTRPVYSTDRGDFKSELLASFPSQLSSIVRVSTQVRVWTVAMLLPRRQDLLGAWGWKSQYTRPPDWYRAWSELPCRDTVMIFWIRASGTQVGRRTPAARLAVLRSTAKLRTPTTDQLLNSGNWLPP